jgi:choline dehydrogenase-like flavoprotein
MSSDGPYDYVIIGGGTAGLVLANRLSEDPNTSVAVVEAGDDCDSDPRVTTPGLFNSIQGTEHDWGFSTTRQVIHHSQHKP